MNPFYRVPRAGALRRSRPTILSDVRQRQPPGAEKCHPGSHKTARGIDQLEAAQDPHQIVNIARGGGPPRFKVLLHAQTSKKGQNDTG
jgi:hypothetical protein